MFRNRSVEGSEEHNGMGLNKRGLLEWRHESGNGKQVEHIWVKVTISREWGRGT